MLNFILRMADNTEVSSALDPPEDTYNPIYLILDSTNALPAPSGPVALELNLPSGFYCDNAEVYFRGTTSSYWQITKEEPTVDTEWSSSVVMSVDGGNSAVFYVRANTVFGEVDILDRAACLEINGVVRCW